MDTQSLVIWVLVGVMTGWLAGIVVKGNALGLLRDVTAGIIGALIGGWLIIHLHSDVEGKQIYSIFTAVAGASLLIVVLHVIKRVRFHSP